MIPTRARTADGAGRTATEAPSMAVARPDAALARRRRALMAALVVAAATAIVTGLAHAIGGGAAPDALLLAAAFVVTLLVLAPVLGSRGSGARQWTAVAVAQLVQHALYSLSSPAAQAGPHASHPHDAAAAAPVAIVHEHASMPLAHVVAGLVTMALLRSVPRAVAAMLDAMSLRRVVAVLSWHPARPRHRACVTAVQPASRRVLEVLGSACGTRGPPPAAV